jgi:hypothetical protein
MSAIRHSIRLCLKNPASHRHVDAAVPVVYPDGSEPLESRHCREIGLVRFAESKAVSHGVGLVYLLTDSALGYFVKMGYAVISRNNAQGGNSGNGTIFSAFAWSVQSSRPRYNKDKRELTRMQASVTADQR